jgi:hypothetical protein
MTIEEECDNNLSLKLEAKESKTQNEEPKNPPDNDENNIDFDKVALALSLGESNFDSGNEMCTNKECRYMGVLTKKKT